MSFVLRHVNAGLPYAFFKSLDHRVVVAKEEADEYPSRIAAERARADRILPDRWVIEEKNT